MHIKFNNLLVSPISILILNIQEPNYVYLLKLDDVSNPLIYHIEDGLHVFQVTCI